MSAFPLTVPAPRPGCSGSGCSGSGFSGCPGCSGSSRTGSAAAFSRRLRVALIALALLVPASFSFARGPVERYPFLSPENNRIVFADNVPSSFSAFYSRLDTLLTGGRNDVRILCLGDSHIQGGEFTRRLRNDLLSLRPGLDGGRGLVFPVRVAGSNTPTSYKIPSYEGEWTRCKIMDRSPEYEIGLAGYALCARDTSARFTFRSHPLQMEDDDTEFLFNQVLVLGSSTGLEPMLSTGDTTLRASGRDSLTGGWNFRLPAPADSVVFSLALPENVDSAGRFILQGLYIDNDAPGLTLSEAGVNGANLLSWRKAGVLERDIALLKPDLVILAMGTNDAYYPGFKGNDFIRHYKELVSAVRRAAPDCAILFLTSPDCCRRVRRNYVTNTNGPIAREAVLSLGADCDAGVWDMFSVMGGLGSIRKWEATGLARKDKMHFTEKGYRLLADLLFEALMDGYGQGIL